MVFSSLLFLTIFLPVTVGLYYLLPKKARNLLLLAVSLVFYAWGEPTHIFVMLITTAYIWVFGLLVARAREQGKQGIAKLFLILTLVLSLGTLVFFKYTGFLVSTMPFLEGTALGGLKIALPIGISFYTFQALSYVIDVYRGEIKAQKNPATFGTYVTLFPQLIAGPIVRYSDVERELAHREHRMSDINAGVRIFLCGLAKKVLLANNAGAMWEQLREIPAAQQTVLGAWLGIAFYTFQIYFDFSGYSDMAIGLGRMLGFRFPENFNYPFTARTITDYWRRWHMTLSGWFRTYVYIPLGGNRRGAARTYLNMLIVWLLTGLWHGANWNFVLWGLFFFAVLAMERAFLGRWLERAPRALGHVYTMLIVLFSFYIFVFDGSAPTLTGAAAMQYLATMLGASGASMANGTLWYDVLRSLLFLLILSLAATPLPKRCLDALCRKLPAIEWVRVALALVALLLCTAYLVDSAYNPFLYFRF